MSDSKKIAIELEKAGADRKQLIEIIDGYGDPIDWSYYSLDSIVGEVWNSDINSGEEPDNWIINEILRQFNLEEVKE